MTTAAQTVPPAGIFIPPHVLNCPGITPVGMVLLGLVVQLNDPKRSCFASTSTLARRVSIDRRTATRLLGTFRERGLLVRKERGLCPAPEHDPVWTTAPPGKPSPPERARPARKTPAEGKPKITQPEALGLDLHIEATEVPKSSPVRGTGILPVNPASPSSNVVTSATSPSSRAGSPCHEVGESPRSQRTRKTSPLEDKLVEICGLETLVGTKAFPGARFGKCLSILRELNATPEELGRYLAWWSDQAISYKRDCPTLEHVSGTFHQSRESKGPRPQARPAAGHAPDPGAWSLRDPEGFAKAHPVPQDVHDEIRRFEAWKAEGKIMSEAMRLAKAGIEVGSPEADNLEGDKA